MRSLIRMVGIPVLLFLTASCAENCAADQVAMGVARLTTMNADALINALKADTKCGFASDAVLGSPTFDSTKIGTVAPITWTVKDCVLDLGSEGIETSRDCQGKAMRAFGKVTVSATKTITGLLTGQPTNPVVPGGPDSVVMTIEATFENFRAEKDGAKATMTWVSGGIAGKLMPRLAVAEGTPYCTIQTTNVAFQDVSYQPTKAVLESDGDQIEVDVDSSDLAGQYGLGPSGENLITGKVSVWGETFDVPIPDDNDGLDPDYNAEEFVASFNCDDAAKQKVFAKPLSYSCQ